MFTKQINASMTSGVLHALPLYRDDEPAIDMRTAARLAVAPVSLQVKIADASPWQS